MKISSSLGSTDPDTRPKFGSIEASVNLSKNSLTLAEIESAIGSTFYSMPTTRSAAKQLHIEDSSKGALRKASSTSTKRKAPSGSEIEPRSGKKAASKRENAANENRDDEHPGEIGSGSEPIIINRAPVLQLWGSVVAKFVHPDLPWVACLSIGNAISSLCAVSKGRSIGLIEPADSTKKDKKTRQRQIGDTRTVKVMGFSLPIKGDAVIVGGKPKPLNGETLKHKFGEQYDAVKAAFEDSLQSWKGHEDELNTKAFHMYEQFRPTVASGQKGWGQKGELSTSEIAKAVRR